MYYFLYKVFIHAGSQMWLLMLRTAFVLWTASRSFVVGSVLINCVTVMKFLRQDTQVEKKANFDLQLQRFMSRVVSITLGLLGGWHKPGSGVRRRDEQTGSVVHLNCIALPHDARISYYALPFKRSTDPCYHCPEDEAFPDSLWGVHGAYSSTPQHMIRGGPLQQLMPVIPEPEKLKQEDLFQADVFNSYFLCFVSHVLVLSMIQICYQNIV